MNQSDPLRARDEIIWYLQAMVAERDAEIVMLQTAQARQAQAFDLLGRRLHFNAHGSEGRAADAVQTSRLTMPPTRIPGTVTMAYMTTESDFANTTNLTITTTHVATIPIEIVMATTEEYNDDDNANIYVEHHQDEEDAAHDSDDDDGVVPQDIASIWM